MYFTDRSIYDANRFLEGLSHAANNVQGHMLWVGGKISDKQYMVLLSRARWRVGRNALAEYSAKVSGVDDGVAEPIHAAAVEREWG